MDYNRRHFVSAAGVIALGGLATACGDKRPGRPPLPMPEEPKKEPEPKPVVPAEPEEGRLVAGFYAAHPELGFSIRPAEPFAPPGRWMQYGWGELWLPDYVDATSQAEIEAEIVSTEPRFEPDVSDGFIERGPKRGTRIILTDPGPFSFSFAGGPLANILAFGLFGQKVYYDLRTKEQVDVIWVGPSFKDLREAYKQIDPNGALVRRLPALAHELWHQYTGNLTHNREVQICSYCAIGLEL